MTAYEDAHYGRPVQSTKTPTDLYNFAWGLTAGWGVATGVEMHLMTDAVHHWWLDAVANRQSPGIPRDGLLSTGDVIDAFKGLLAWRDAWPPAPDYKPLREGAELFVEDPSTRPKPRDDVPPDERQ